MFSPQKKWKRGTKLQNIANLYAQLPPKKFPVCRTKDVTVTDSSTVFITDSCKPFQIFLPHFLKKIVSASLEGGLACYSAEKSLTEFSHQRPTVGFTLHRATTLFPVERVAALSWSAVSAIVACTTLIFHQVLHPNVQKLWKQYFYCMKEGRKLILCTSEFKELWNSFLQYYSTDASVKKVTKCIMFHDNNLISC